jgi:hypothetical protein
MLSPTTALLWEIWLRKRGLIGLLVGVLLLAWVFNLMFARSLVASGDALSLVSTVNTMLLMSSLLVAVAIVSYTDFNPQQETVGFPHRLFVLPISSMLLVALPLLVGIVVVLLVALMWTWLGFGSEPMDPAWVALVLGVYMVFHQTILWTFSRLRALRMIVIGVVALIHMIVAAVPSFPASESSPWLSKGVVGAFVAGAGLLCFLVAWGFVARQRSGGGSRRILFEPALDSIADALPRRRNAFASPAAAQFWFEWRRSGTLLPFCVGGLLLFVIAPISWSLQNDQAALLRIWIVVVAMPIVLALPIGKGFSKPDFWSSDLALPSFTAVRPLATVDLVTVKMKVAALSVLAAWSLVIPFVTLWFPLSSDALESSGLWAFVVRLYEGQAYQAYVALILTILAAFLLTWRFLVAGLWIGLSGNRMMFAASAIPYGFAPIFIGIAIFLVFGKRDPISNWARDSLDRPDLLIGIGAFAILAKFCLSWLAWRKIEMRSVRRYLFFWVGGTVCLTGFAILLWIGFRNLLPGDPSLWRIVLVLAAILFIPLARPGLAPLFLDRNRHR